MWPGAGARMLAAMTLRLPTLALAGALCALAAVPAAQASEIGYDGDDLIFAAAPGEANSVAVYESKARGVGYVSIADTKSDTTYPADKCQPAEGRIDCEARGAIYISLGDGEDDFSMGIGEKLVNPVAVLGGAGDDKLTGNRYNKSLAVLVGEDGNDTLKGGPGDEQMLGGPGDDTLDGGAGADQLKGEDGNDTLDGDNYEAPGADLIDGGAGIDTAAGWTQPDKPEKLPTTVKQDDQPNDGRPGENDDVRGIERITSHVSGTFEMTDADDIVDVWANQDSGASTVLAKGGNDRVKGGSNAETLDGGPGNDRLEGGFGNDTITGGPGKDEIFGDRTGEQCGLFESCTVPFGNDVIDARDGEADQVDCGPGTDKATVDAIDTVSGCEEVSTAGVTPTGPSGPGTTPAGPNAPQPGTTAKGRAAVSASARRRGGRVVVSGRLVPRAGTAKSACAGAKVSIVLTTRGGKAVARGTAKVRRTCRFTASVKAGRGAAKATVKLTGSAKLAAATKKVSVR